MSRFVAILLGAVFVQSSAFVAPGAPQPALRSGRYEQMRRAEIPQETNSSSPLGAVVMASFMGLILGLTSPKMAFAEEKKAPVVEAKLKAEVAKAQAAIQKNAKSKEDRLKEQIAQLKEVEKTADLNFATK